MDVGVTVSEAPPAARVAPPIAEAEPAAWRETLGKSLTSAAIPTIAILATMVLFGIFVAFTGPARWPSTARCTGASFGTWFSFQNTLLRAAPLHADGAGDGAAAAARPGGASGAKGRWCWAGSARRRSAIAHAFAAARSRSRCCWSGPLVGGLWIALAGALRAYRGVNETISSLLLTYIAIALLNHLVEGSLRDPASLNKPSTLPIGDDNMLAAIPGLDVHWGLGFGLIACLVTWVLMQHTTFGFAARMVGGNTRAALLNGLPVAAPDRDRDLHRRGSARAWRARSRWRRSTATPTRRW